MTDRKNDKRKESEDPVKEMLEKELKRRRQSKGREKNNISALSGKSPDSQETLQKEDIWGAEAGAKRNIIAEAKHNRQVEQQRLEKSQQQMQQEHNEQWQSLESSQDQELQDLEQSQKAEIEQKKIEHTQARQELATDQSIARQEKKVEHRAKLAEKKATFKVKKKQAWSSHMNKELIKDLKNEHLREMTAMMAVHEQARESLIHERDEQLTQLESQQQIEETNLLNAQQQELLKLTPKPGIPASKQQEQDIAQLKEKHAMQLAELKARHSEQKSEIRGNYIFKRNELIDNQNAEISETKQVHKQQLRDIAKPQQVLQEVKLANQQDLKSLDLGYRSFLTNQTTKAIELKSTQLKIMNAVRTQQYRAKTELLKNHESQRIALSQSQNSERQAYGYSTKIPNLDTPKIDLSGSSSDDDYDTRLGM